MITGYKSFMAIFFYVGEWVLAGFDTMVFVRVWCNVPRITLYECGLYVNFERFSRALMVFVRLVACSPLGGVCQLV